MDHRHLIAVGMTTILALTGLQDASATEVEKLVMPGEVVESHADFEGECSKCHKLFKKAEQNNLCLDCHDDVATDVEQNTGFHGLSHDVSNQACSSCHTDHIGRDADIVDLDESTFDHAVTDFELVGKHLEAPCEDCHEAGLKHREATAVCIDCHPDDDPHEESLGTSCGDCHTAVGWEEAQFDHDTTGFSLIGHHRETACLDCHADSTYLDAPTDCFSCHQDDDAHEGRSGKECGNCHSPVGWEDTEFDHSRDTEFPLEGSHGELSCDDCHSDDPFADEMDRSCSACHLEDDNHDGHNGTKCDSCHGATKWEDPVFDHDRDTDYALHGAHEEIACKDCHVDPIFETELQSVCNACHLEDDAHEGQQGDRCQDCHDETSWEEAPRFSHDLTSFPLLGEHQNLDCDECHTSRVFPDADNDCVGCHGEDDPHRGNLSGVCSDCHNPVAWDLWQFDHSVRSDFELDGAHLDVACDTCHRSPLDTMQGKVDTCGSCHRPDDIHDGEFGPHCGRCHGDASFTVVRSLQ